MGFGTGSDALYGPDVDPADVASAAGQNVMTIRLFGGFMVSVGSRTVPDTAWSLRKVKGLVKLLALAPAHQLHREQLMDLLWPELEPDAAANNLHKAFHLARRALEPDLPPKHPSSYLRLHGDIASLDASLSIDVEEFRAAAAAARLSRDPVLYEEALSLYSGDLLPEDRYEDWAASEREELRNLRFSLLLELAGLWETRVRIGAAAEAFRLVVVSDPVNEEATCGLMRLLSRSGQRHLALRQYQRLRDALRRDLDAEPAPEVVELYDRIRSGERLPAASSSIVLTDDSKTDGFPLVGRSAALEACDTLLEDLTHGRGGLAIVSGDAGAGKTRLAAEVAARGADRGIIVLRGTPHREMRRPYGVLADAIEELTSRLSPADLRALLGASAPELSKVVPSVQTALGSHLRAASALNRRDLFAAMADLLHSLAQRAPVLLIIDDLDAADDETLELLLYLLRMAAQMRLLVLGTRTCGSENSQAYVNLDHLARRIELEPLTLAETTQLVCASLMGQVHSEVHEAIHAVARGNPSFTREAIEAFVGRDYIAERNGRWSLDDGPRSLLSTLRLRTRGGR
jgi:DNA-binding SARP family transcriptional activator